MSDAGVTDAATFIDLRPLEPALPADALLVAVTEKRTRAELDRYVQTMRRVLQ